MAGAFPAMGNPAAGVSAASGLGNQFLGFLSNLPQQIMQWQQIKQNRQDNAYKNLQVLSQLGTNMPGVAGDQRFGQAFMMNAKELGIDPKTFMTPQGQFNTQIFSSAAMKQLLSDPTTFKAYTQTPPEQRQQLWATLGEEGQAPDAFINGPYRAPITPSILQQFGQLGDDTLKIGPLAAAQKLQAIAPALLSNGYDVTPMLQAIQDAASSPQYAGMLQKMADAHHVSLAQYQKDVQQTLEAVAHTGLYNAQTRKTNTETDTLIPAQVALTKAHTAEAGANTVRAYAQADEATALANLNSIKKENLTILNQYQDAHGILRGTSADKTQSHELDWQKTRLAAGENIRKASGTLAALYNAYGLINSTTGQPLTGDQFNIAFKQLAPAQQQNIKDAIQAVNDAKAAEAASNSMLYEQLRTGPKPPFDVPSGYTAGQDAQGWYITNDGGKTKYRHNGGH